MELEMQLDKECAKPIKTINLSLHIPQVLRSDRAGLTLLSAAYDENAESMDIKLELKKEG